jgi:hypothetical protein
LMEDARPLVMPIDLAVSRSRSHGSKDACKQGSQSAARDTTICLVQGKASHEPMVRPYPWKEHLDAWLTCVKCSEWCKCRMHTSMRNNNPPDFHDERKAFRTYHQAPCLIDVSTAVSDQQCHLVLDTVIGQDHLDAAYGACCLTTCM